MVRMYCPQVMATVTVYVVLEGISSLPDAQQFVEDWAEAHCENEQIRVLSWKWFRDQYGRVLGDLCDMSTGECLTDAMLEAGVATPRPEHFMDVLRECGGA